MLKPVLIANDIKLQIKNQLNCYKLHFMLKDWKLYLWICLGLSRKKTEKRWIYIFDDCGRRSVELFTLLQATSHCGMYMDTP